MGNICNSSWYSRRFWRHTTGAFIPLIKTIYFSPTHRVSISIRLLIMKMFSDRHFALSTDSVVLFFKQWRIYPTMSINNKIFENKNKQFVQASIKRFINSIAVLCVRNNVKAAIVSSSYYFHFQCNRHFRQNERKELVGDKWYFERSTAFHLILFTENISLRLRFTLAILICFSHC